MSPLQPDCWQRRVDTADCRSALRKISERNHPQVYPIVNEFFGEKITVSGLLTGQDLKKQLTGKELGEQLLLPCNMLRTGYDVFLDDVTVEELEEALQVTPVIL